MSETNETAEQVEETVAVDLPDSETTEEQVDARPETETEDTQESYIDPVTTNFADNHREMGLIDIGDEAYFYADQYSEVKYCRLVTKNRHHDTPVFSIMTRNPNVPVADGDPLEGFRHAGYVTGAYNFVGNESLVSSIRESVAGAGQAVFREYPSLGSGLVSFMTEMVIENPNTVDEVGVIKPQINISNSYNGTAKAKVSFGFSVFQDVNRAGFSFWNKLVKIDQIHIRNSSAIMSGPIGDFVTMFSDNITGLIRSNFQNALDDDDTGEILELIEKSGLGKNRRTELTEHINALDGKTSWNIFHILTRYSTLEKNFNAKKILQNVAESVLVVPAEIMDVVDRFNSQLSDQVANAA